MFTFTDVRYKNILLINNLTIEANQITSMVGESGAGKSTLLRLMNKLISYDQGVITFNNDPLDQLDAIELRRRVVMLPQTPAIYPGTIRENLLIGLRFSDKPIVMDEHLNEMLQFVQLDKALDDDASRLSGGEKQRLALARVILLDPEVFLLDEPSSALDEKTAHIVIERLASYTREHNKTLIMVTHSKAIANQYSDHIIQLDKGRIQEVVK